MTDSLLPRYEPAPAIRYQPSMLSVPSAASTVAPETPAPPPLRVAPGAKRKLWFFVAVGALGAVASGVLRDFAHVSPHVHHGSPGFRQAKNGENQRWHRGQVTVYIDDSVAKLDPRATDAVTRAFGHWVESQGTLPALTFDTGKTSATPQKDGKSTVSYGRITVPGHERDLAITMTYSSDQTGEIIEADIMLNSAYPLAVLGALQNDEPHAAPNTAPKREGKSSAAGQSEDCRDRYDLQNVATHEVGHFFGLGEDMIERSSTMFPSIDECETHKRVLAVTDTAAMSQLYSQLETSEDEAPSARGCSFVAAPAVESNLAWLPALALGLLTIRRRRVS